MNQKTFDDIVDQQFLRCLNVLRYKSPEYSIDGDRLHNFKVAAELKRETPRQALIGMMVKHTVSVFDMGLSVRIFPDAIWEEKITDSINYLLLLKAILSEENDALILRKMQTKEELAKLATTLANTANKDVCSKLIDWEKEA